LPFQFKQFAVDDSLCAMKIGTDAVLLGAWTDVLQAENILDIGTGSGIISLMLAQKCNASIIAIDIDKAAAQQAALNFKNAPWENKLLAKNISLQDFMHENNQLFDVIVCNPPYFENALKSHSEQRNTARHNDLLSLDILFEKANLLMHNNACLNIIFPSEQENKIIEAAYKQGLFAHKLCRVFPNAEKSHKRLLISFCKTISKEPIIEEELIIEKNKRHEYSDAYKKLTQDYYLKF
jgi:tRNA1Val (adenine37-N6)-methyltransferase